MYINVYIMIYELMINLKPLYIREIWRRSESRNIQKNPVLKPAGSKGMRIRFLNTAQSDCLWYINDMNWYDISTDFYISGVDWLNHWLFQVNGRYCTFHFLKYVRAKGENSPKLLLYYSSSLGTWNGHWLEDVPWYGWNLMP